MCCLISQAKTVRSCKVNLDFGPSLLRCSSRLPYMISIWEQPGVINKSKCNFNNNRVAVRLSSRYNKGSSIFDLLEQYLNRLVGIIVTNPMDQIPTMLPLWQLQLLTLSILRGGTSSWTLPYPF
jgi:hypothetical protein